ncbi:hypothetical protein MXB_3394, partial [Myxobolus squamalis]
MSASKKNIFKVIIIGDPCIGKTALANRISKKSFTSHYKATSGFDMFSAELLVGENRNITFNIIDTAGLERYTALTNNFYRGADSVILCFDVTNQASFDNIDRWKNEFLVAGNPQDPLNYPFVLAATKIDIESRVVDESRLQRWSQLNNKVPYVETSAKNDIGVTELFSTVANELIKREPKIVNHIPPIPGMINLNPAPSSDDTN